MMAVRRAADSLIGVSGPKRYETALTVIRDGSGYRMTSFRVGSRASRAWWVATIALCAILAAPLMVVDVPPLLDYPNHLARVYVLASLPRNPLLAEYYAPHWSIIPNLALDLIAPPLIGIMPIHVAGRLMIAVALLLPTVGSIAYNVSIGGRWWALGTGLVSYNACLLYGFLNFEISLGLALLLAAAWLRWRQDYPARTVALAAAGAVSLFACHLMGLVFFGLLIGGAEMVRIDVWAAMSGVTRRRAGIVPGTGQTVLFAKLIRSLGALVLVFAVPAVLYGLSDLGHLGGDAEYLPLGAKLLQLQIAFVNYDRGLDVTTAIVALSVPALALLLRLGRFPGPAAVTIGALIVVFLTAPFAWKGTQSLDTRFAIMLAFMLFAGFVPTHWPRALSFSVGTAVTMLFLSRIILLTTAWAAHRTDLADLRAVLRTVQPGQSVYVAEAGLREAPAYWARNPNWRLLSNGVRTDEHLGALALIEHQAYWPFEFDNASQQPIETREPYRSRAERIGGLPNWGETVAADVCGFDYVLLVAADAVPTLPSARFRLIAEADYAALYQIVKCRGDR